MADKHNAEAVDVDPKSLKLLQDTWAGFTKLMTISIISVISIVALMAIFLV